VRPTGDATKTSLYSTWVDTRAFAVSASVNASTTQAVGHPDVTGTIVPQGASDVRSGTILMPRGLSGSLASAPLCTVANGDAGTCSSASKVGTLTATGVFTSEAEQITATGDIFITDSRQSSSAASLSFKVVLPNNLGDVIAFAHVNLVNNGFNQQIVIPNVPNQTSSGKRFHITNFVLFFDGDLGSPNNPFITNPSSCPATPQTIVGNATAYDGATAPTVNVPYPVTGCATVPFQPTINQTFSNPVAGGESGVTATLNLPLNHSAIFRLRMLEPPKIGANFPAFGASADQCPSASAPSANPPLGTVPFNPATCPAQARVGTMTVTTPLLPTPLTGNVYLIAKTPLPWFGVDLQKVPGITVRLIGVTSTPQVDPTCPPDLEFCQTQIAVLFGNIPDVPATQVVFDLSGSLGPRTGVGGDGVLGTADDAVLSPYMMVFSPEGDATCDPAQFTQAAVASITPWARPTTTVNVSQTINVTGCP
jgi:hypothetical protein